LKELELTHITYRKDDGTTTDRFIIPTKMPNANIKAFDVTSLSEEDRSRMSKLYSEYREYVDTALASLFKFEDWVEHTQNEKVEVTWRTFKDEQTAEVID